MNNYYTLIGKDKKLVDIKVKEVKKTISSDYDEIYIDLEEENIYDLVEHIETVSFLYEIKFIVCKNASNIKESNYKKSILDRLIELLSKPSSDIILVFIFDDIDSKNKYHKEIKKLTEVIKIINVENKDIKSYLVNYINEEGFNIENIALEELLIRTNNELTLTINELKKLVTYKYEEKNITVEDVKKLVSNNVEDNVFVLVEAVLEKNKTKIFKIYEDMMIKNVDEIALIAILLNKFNEMYQIKTLLEDQMSKDQIANIFNVKPGRVYYMTKSVEYFSLYSIKENINKLSKLEYEVKTGKIDKKMGLQLYLLT